LRTTREDALGDRYLVTGGAGFVGATVTRALLDRGDEVTILDTGAAAGFDYVKATSARLVKADIRDRDAVDEALEGCRAIVHLAAQASVPDSIARPLEDLAINVDASLGLLEAARERRVERVVFASSNAVIGGHPPPAHEELVPLPVSPYGASKAAIETYLRAYQEAYGLSGVALRFANAYGPWSAHKGSVVAAFIRAYLAGGPLIIRGNGRQTRDFVHVSDISAVVLACLDAPAELVHNQIFQVGTGQETSLLELAELLMDVGGKPVPVEHEPPSAGDVPRNVSDIGKASRALHYSPKVALRDGLADTLDWFRGNWRA
jgi:UDP-glucose 4-epimerase